MGFLRCMSLKSLFLVSMVTLFGIHGCTPVPRLNPDTSTSELSNGAGKPEPTQGARQAMELLSEAFQAGEAIPERYTCAGENISPQLAWLNPPEGSTYIVLTLDDPDAPGSTWVHWLAYNIPVGVGVLEAGVGSDPTLDGFGAFGLNSWGETSYGGPCPPTGTHRYFFRLYALDEALTLPSPPTMSQLQQAMIGHVLAEANLMGLFARGD